jgi:DNA topoisomerase-1
MLEKLGIGRPSTYASIISTIVDRGYVKKDGRAFHATELGLIVNDLLVGNFARVVDTDFTAKMETQLDQIEEGNLNWVEVMTNFNELFKTELIDAEEKIAKIKGVTAKDSSGADIPCPLCSIPMVTRWSKDGKFFGCANYPECKGTLPVGADGNPVRLTKEDIECPKCTAPMVVRMSSRGAFLGCSEFPKCRGTRALESSKSAEEKSAERQFAGLVCNKCGSDMAVRIARGKPFIGCTAYPECKNALSLKKVETALAEGDMEIDPDRREVQLAKMDEEAAKLAAAMTPAAVAG